MDPKKGNDVIDAEARAHRRGMPLGRREVDGVIAASLGVDVARRNVLQVGPHRPHRTRVARLGGDVQREAAIVRRNHVVGAGLPSRGKSTI